MTKDDYLKMAGYSSAEWTVLDQATSKKYLEQKGAINAMYPIKDRKAVESLGKGHYLVKKSWMMKVVDDISDGTAAPTVVMEEAKEVIDKVIPPTAVPPPPSPPDISGVQIPPPPPPPTAEQVAEHAEALIEDAGDEELEDDILEAEEEFKTFNEAPYGDDDEDVIHVEDTSNGEVKPTFYCVKDLEDEGCCDEQCKECAEKEKTFAAEEEAREQLEEIVEKSGVSVGNVIIAQVPSVDNIRKALEGRLRILEDNGFIYNKDTKRFTHILGLYAEEEHVKSMNAADFDKAVKDLLKAVEGKEKAKAQKEAEAIANVPEKPKETKVVPIVSPTKKEIETIKETAKKAEEVVKDLKKDKKAKPIKHVPVASKTLAEQFEVVDQVIAAAEAFKKVHYALAQIKDIIDPKHSEKYSDGEAIDLIHDVLKTL